MKWKNYSPLKTKVNKKNLDFKSLKLICSSFYVLLLPVKQSYATFTFSTVANIMSINLSSKYDFLRFLPLTSFSKDDVRFDNLFVGPFLLMRGSSHILSVLICVKF